MKKVLATVAALGLVLGVAGNVLALDEPGKQATVPEQEKKIVPEPTAPGVALWSVKGSWVLAGAYLSNGLGATPNGGQVDIQEQFDQNDAFYIYSVKILPTLQVNDKISLQGEVRFIDRDVYGHDTGDSTTRDIDIFTLWMNWESPYGKFQAGRMPAGAWGTTFANSTRQGDRIRIWPNMLPENWDSLIFLEKRFEEDVLNQKSDGDFDFYYVHLGYKAPFGKTTAALLFQDNARGAGQSVFETRFWLTGNYTFGAIGMEYEVEYDFGDANSAGDDLSTLGLYADVNYKMQDWKFGGLAFYMSGDDDLSAGSDVESHLGSGGTGNDFNPFQIMTGDYMGFLNADKGQVHPAILNNGSTAPGVWAIQGYASFAMTPAMSLSGYLGYAAALEEPTGWDDDYGMEAGLGMGYKLMDNLTYNAHFSYLWTGDYFQEGGAETTRDVWLLAHALSMSF